MEAFQESKWESLQTATERSEKQVRITPSCTCISIQEQTRPKSFCDLHFLDIFMSHHQSPTNLQSVTVGTTVGHFWSVLL